MPNDHTATTSGRATGFSYDVLDLFSGIGGFSLGLERAGMRTTAFCEIDPYCQRVLARHWPDVPIHSDIRNLDGSQFAGAVDVICGGYPCQPFSEAGKKQGEKDPRHLWPEMHRIIREARPRWVIAENVRGHISLGFDTVAAQLENEGFAVWPFVVPACAIGAPHRRDRLWILAHANAGGGSTRGEPGRRKARTDLSWGSKGPTLGHSPSAGLHACAQTGVHRQTESEGARDAEFERRGGIVADSDSQSSFRAPIAREECNPWATEPDVGRVAHGVPDRVDRIRSLGNAVVPQIPELLGRAIRAYEQQIGLAA
jgi:DNA (cytosine-5)-methyltransferase 1